MNNISKLANVWFRNKGIKIWLDVRHQEMGIAQQVGRRHVLRVVVAAIMVAIGRLVFPQKNGHFH